MEGGAVGHNFERDPPGTIPARFGLIWFSGFRGEDLNETKMSSNFNCSYMAMSSLVYIYLGIFCEIFLSADLYRLCKLGIF
jgi:hypothetical protein